MALTPNSDVEPGFTVVSYRANIEAEADGIYKQMYDENTSIDKVVAMLQRYKESTNPQDHEVCSCMLHFPLDEYKLFQSYCSARELAMTVTGYLFGFLIPPKSNLFKFGPQALSQFGARRPESQPLCAASAGDTTTL